MAEDFPEYVDRALFNSINMLLKRTNRELTQASMSTLVALLRTAGLKIARVDHPADSMDGYDNG